MSDKRMRPPKQIGSYQIKHMIGSGSFAVVHLCTNTKDNKDYAMKIVNKATFKQKEVLDHFEMEIRVLHQMRHQNIVQFIDLLKDDNFIYVILELCPCGDLFNFIIDKKFLSESEAKVMFKQIISGLNYIHSIGAMHRDLKPENILLDSTGMAKISDFGFARFAPSNNLVKTPCGTTSYASPECIAGKPYDGIKSDMWSIGVILFAMITGQLPWTEKNHAGLHQQIMKGEYKVPEYVSPKLKELIESLMNIDPDKRPTTQDLLAHSWLEGADTLELPYVQPAGVSLKYLDKFFQIDISDLAIPVQEKKQKKQAVSSLGLSYEEIRKYKESQNVIPQDASTSRSPPKITVPPSAAEFLKRKQLLCLEKGTHSSLKVTERIKTKARVTSYFIQHKPRAISTKLPALRKPMPPKLNR
ncbi:CBL-interacting serine/threonine-protein kinase 9 [Tritrichomonas foetus]|uniref:CBL-interacting serine/threonine-protein kinase 9 n=1 Tax=Tritrichomonas foetus TaxID=1144522 RepID=A0A1J4JYQ3_9EUKA|nr:CBL-interacting serine/threonine-protein kinase 9 [Tritrichomonas foetus]|eukprot:OHT02630.1 CBL-interacting serine/threonine-protein kinase 9 [Tritrichomonas foetus]